MLGIIIMKKKPMKLVGEGISLLKSNKERVYRNDLVLL